MYLDNKQILNDEKSDEIDEKLKNSLQTNHDVEEELSSCLLPVMSRNKPDACSPSSHRFRKDNAFKPGK